MKGNTTAFLSAKDAKDAKKSFLLLFASFASFADQKLCSDPGQVRR
jgi:hypothetical protein